MSGFLLFLFGLGGEIAGADKQEAEDENGKNCRPGSRRDREFCGAAVKKFRPEGLSRKAAGESRAADGITAIFRRWRKDIRRARWNPRRQVFPPSSDKSNPPGGP